MTQLRKLIFVILLISCTLIHGSVSAVPSIPLWIKNSAQAWSENKISDYQFVQSIQHLVKNEMISIPPQESYNQNTYFLPSYGQTVQVELSGRITDFKEGALVFLTVTKPDGTTLSLTASAIERHYNTIMILNSDSPLGKYVVTGKYDQNEIPTSYFYVEKPSQIQIPSWFTKNANWWSAGKISDTDYVSGIQFLLDKKIMKLESKKQETKSADLLNVNLDGTKVVYRGTTQSMTVHVTNGTNPVSNARVWIEIKEDPVDLDNDHADVIKEFDGRTDAHGMYNFSWEIDSNMEPGKLIVYVDVTNGFSSTGKTFSFEVVCNCNTPSCANTWFCR